MNPKMSGTFVFGLIFSILMLNSPMTMTEDDPKGIPPPTPPAGCKFDNNIAYRSVNGKDIKLDLMWNPEGKPLPCVIWIHGGGWKNGNKVNKKSGGRMINLVTNGIAMASIDYRLSGEAKYPAQIEDCQEAVRFLRKNASKYNLDPNKFATWGESAGGHLSALVAVKNGKDAEVQAAVSYYGGHDLNDDGKEDKSSVIGLLGGTPEEKPEAYKDAKCSTHVSSSSPPILMVHGDKDAAVPLSQSQKLAEALTKAGVWNKLVVVKGATHMFRGPDGSTTPGNSISPTREEIEQLTLDFFKEKLLSPASKK